MGTGITALIFMTEPTATRVAATKRTAMLVDVVEVERGTFRPVIVATGTVEAEQDIILSPQVGGQVLSLSSTFTPGGFVKKGQVLLQIDPADYQNALLEKKSDLRRATADLNIEMGRQNVAQKDYQILNETLSGELEALVLRQPQLNA
ncbi:MAG: biotin/lipoyl-binding protein, partial [Candidatus Latescibacteria bacterium]|nr:biotin/lipoyl-binding protein [Candidatus Latescibacterota bacterium]